MASNVSDDKKIDNLNENTEKQSTVFVNLKPADSISISKKFHSSCKLKFSMKADNKINSIVSWDPLLSSDWDAAGPPGHLASTRIKRDLSSLFKEPLPGIFVIPDEKNFCLVHCLILGPFDTPYEGGFFHFAVRFGPSYPIHPPRVRFMTTDGGKVRFNPNLYSNGKVCLSIVGTWSGPVWSPALNLGSLLLSIQSLLNEKPYFNEPGFKTEHYHGESDRYNILITHETIRVAVCGQLEHILSGRRSWQHLPSELADVIKDSFVDLYDCYVETCNKYKHLDGQEMADIFTPIKRVYGFSSLLERLKRLKERSDSMPSSSEESSLSSISDEEEIMKGDKENAIIDEANDECVADESQEPPEASGSSPVEREYTIDDDLQLFVVDDDDDDDDDDKDD